MLGTLLTHNITSRHTTAGWHSTKPLLYFLCGCAAGRPRHECGSSHPTLVERQKMQMDAVKAEKLAEHTVVSASEAWSPPYVCGGTPAGFPGYSFKDSVQS